MKNQNKTTDSSENKIYSLAITEDVSRRIASMSLINCVSAKEEIVVLISTALKYNYTPTYRYIPCKPRSSCKSSKEADLSGKTIPTKYHIIFSFIGSKKTEQRFLEFIKANHISSFSEAARTLIETALIYDYNDDGRFIKPERITFTTPSLNPNADNHIYPIFLDIK